MKNTIRERPRSTLKNRGQGLERQHSGERRSHGLQAFRGHFRAFRGHGIGRGSLRFGRPQQHYRHNRREALGEKADVEHPYGHERFESVAAIVLSVILCVTGLFIGRTAIENMSAGFSGAQAPGTLALSPRRSPS